MEIEVTSKDKGYVSIMDIAPDQVKNTKGLCICDKCQNTFKPEETLMEECNNIEFAGLLSVKGITKGKSTYYLISPCCKQVHLFGFDMKSI